MILKTPYINNIYLKCMYALYQTLADNYNKEVREERSKGDLSRNPLKAAHFNLFRTLIYLAGAKMMDRYTDFKSDATRVKLLQRNAGLGFLLSTNRSQLSVHTKMSESTCYRLLQRLMDAQIIHRDREHYHGPCCNFELIISPNVLLISDYFNTDFCPADYFLKTSQNQQLKNSLRSVCTLYSITRYFKNEVIQEQDKVSRSLETFENLHETIYKNIQESEEGGINNSKILNSTSKINTFDNIINTMASAFKGNLINALGAKKYINTNTDSDIKINTQAVESYSDKLKKAEDSYNHRLQKYALIFVNYLIVHLYTKFGRKVYDGEILNAKEAAIKYFETYASMSASVCEKEYELLKRRVDMVVRQIEKNQYKLNIGPAWYINQNNPTGFVRTERWLKQDEVYKKLNAYNRLRTTNEQKLNYALNQVYNKKDLNTYETMRSYLEKKAPRVVQEFELHAKSFFEISIPRKAEL